MFLILVGMATAKILFLKIILQAGGITMERMIRNNVYYNLIIKYYLNFSLD